MKEVVQIYAFNGIHLLQEYLDKGCQVKHIVAAGTDHREYVIILLVPPSVDI
jgi:hypothetical protein